MKTYSINFLAEAFEVDRATATRCLRDVPPDQEQTIGRGTFKIASFARALELHHLKNASANNASASDSGGAASLTAARVRITLANAEARERENEVAAGKLCHVADVAGQFGLLISVFHEKLLSVPGKIADSLTPYTPVDRGKIMEKVKSEIFDYMRAVQDGAKEVTSGLDARALGGVN
jgi:hypothetical protein